MRTLSGSSIHHPLSDRTGTVDHSIGLFWAFALVLSVRHGMCSTSHCDPSHAAILPLNVGPIAGVHNQTRLTIVSEQGGGIQSLCVQSLGVLQHVRLCISIDGVAVTSYLPICNWGSHQFTQRYGPGFDSRSMHVLFPQKSQSYE